MDNVKPWQIILVILALLALGFSVWKYSMSSVKLPNSVLVVDVESGDLYRIDISKRNGGYFPERNPDTGKHTLMPVAKNDDGQWFIVPHARAAMQDINGENRVVDESSWRVTIASEKILKSLNAGS